MSLKSIIEHRKQTRLLHSVEHSHLRLLKAKERVIAPSSHTYAAIYKAQNMSMEIKFSL